jgi:hypothetical protein
VNNTADSFIPTWARQRERVRHNRRWFSESSTSTRRAAARPRPSAGRRGHADAQLRAAGRWHVRVVFRSRPTACADQHGHRGYNSRRCGVLTVSVDGGATASSPPTDHRAILTATRAARGRHGKPPACSSVDNVAPVYEDLRRVGAPTRSATSSGTSRSRQRRQRQPLVAVPDDESPIDLAVRTRPRHQERPESLRAAARGRPLDFDLLGRHDLQRSLPRSRRGLCPGRKQPISGPTGRTALIRSSPSIRIRSLSDFQPHLGVRQEVDSLGSWSTSRQGWRWQYELGNTRGTYFDVAALVARPPLSQKSGTVPGRFLERGVTPGDSAAFDTTLR